MQHIKSNCRKCLYDPNTSKYLAQTRDEVEQGDEKVKELEAELREIGLYDHDFSLGDILDEQDDSEKPEGTKKPPKLPEFPVVEGEETVVEYVGQYKKACLNRKALLKSTKERLEKDQAKGYENLFCNRKRADMILQNACFKKRTETRNKHQQFPGLQICFW